MTNTFSFLLVSVECNKYLSNPVLGSSPKKYIFQYAWCYHCNCIDSYHVGESNLYVQIFLILPVPCSSHVQEDLNISAKWAVSLK